MKTSRRRGIAVAAGALALALSLSRPLAGFGGSTVDAWIEALRSVDAQLRDAEWHASELAFAKLTRRMLKQLGTGPGASYALGLVSLYRAVALQGLDRAAEAHWYRSVAFGLDPQLRAADLTPYGDAGVALSALPAPVPPLQEAGDHGWAAEGPTTAPDCSGNRNPRFPFNLHLREVGAHLVVQFILDREGRTSSPKILQPAGGPAETFIALDTLRGWKCNPATQNGEPVNVNYTMTFDFRFADR